VVAAPAPAPVARPAEPLPPEAEDVGVLDETIDLRRRRADDAPPPNGEGVRPNQWVYLFDKRQRGPLELDDLIDLVLTSLREDTKVWQPGMRDWTPANLVQEIAEQIPPPLPFTGAGEEDFPDFNTVPEVLRTALIADEDEGFRKLLALPLALAGIYFYFFTERGRQFRVLGWMFLVPLVLFLVAKGRGYYLAPVYPMLYAGGAVLGESWLQRCGRGWRVAMTSLAFVALLLNSAMVALVFLPIAPVNSPWWQRMVQINGDLREEIGWQELVENVARIRDSLSPEERRAKGWRRVAAC
jgi:hypothetical protein